jgi:hypothetical protein
MLTVPLCPKCGFSQELHTPIWGCQSVTIPNDSTSPYHARVKTGVALENMVGELLTDRKISRYEGKGYYQPDARKARKDRAEKKGKGRSNFIERDGRLIYSIG